MAHRKHLQKRYLKSQKRNVEYTDCILNRFAYL